MADLSLRQARRIALTAQGFIDPRPGGTVDVRHLRRVLGRIGLIQMDSVNVLQRAHYMPLFSRLGGYPPGLLDRAAYRKPRALFEYWGHEASLMPMALHPYLRWRMARARDDAWGGMRTVARDRPDLIDWVRQEVREKGPLTAAQIEDDTPRATGNWGWNWSDAKRAVEYLFWCGEVATASRNGSFARVYDVPERVIPAEILNAPTPSDADAYRELMRISGQALGIAGPVELRDYFRLPVDGARQAIADLVDSGELLPVTVTGWSGVAYLHRDAKLPRWVRARTLVSPFDPLVWERARAERLFGFRYRIEIYVPAEQRVHGYYVLPFLLGDELVARVDLKADRKAGVLRVPGAWAEPGRSHGDLAEALAGALRDLADWLELSDIAAPDKGDLAKPLRLALKAGG